MAMLNNQRVHQYTIPYCFTILLRYGILMYMYIDDPKNVHA